MWRALFLALGVSCMILGAECLAIEKAVLQVETKEQGPFGAAAAKREIAPPEWAPWSLLSAGAVVILYSFTIPRRRSE